MKWYKAIVDLKDHRKRFELEAELNTIHGLHYIHCWFTHVAKFYEMGDCSKLAPGELARACEWKGEPKVIFDAFVKCGFIDKDLVGGLIVHNWFFENARFLKENGKDAPQGKPTGKPRVVRGKTVLQDNTLQDLQDKNMGIHFDNFWEACSDKRGKEDAKEAWKKLKPEEKSLAIKCRPFYDAECLKKGTEQQFIKSPGPWLNKKRWQDVGVKADCQHDWRRFSQGFDDDGKMKYKLVCHFCRKEK